MSGLLLLLVLPLAMAGVVYVLLRRAFSLAALLSVGTTLAMGIAAVTLPVEHPVSVGTGGQVVLGESLSFFGREFVLLRADRVAMALMFFSAAGLFLLSWRFAPRALLFPMGLGLLSLLGAALLIRPPVYAALLIGIAAALSVFALQAEERPPTRGGQRYLVFATLALPGILVTHWLLERYAVMPDETGLLGAAAVLLAISFAMLLGSVPFHTWVPAVAGDSVPMAGAFILTVGNGAVWFLLLDFLEAYPWLSSHPHFGSLVSAAGAAMLIVGMLLAPLSRRLGVLLGYAAMADSGAALLSLSLGTRVGVTLVLLSLLARPFGVLLMAAGLSGLRMRAGDDGFESLRGAGWRAPWSAAALVFGALSLAGMPISAGFIWRWALCRALAPSHPVAALLVLLSGVLVMVGVWRCLVVLLDRPVAPKDRSVMPLDVEGGLTAVVVLLAILLCVGVGPFIVPMAAWLAEAYTFFMR